MSTNDLRELLGRRIDDIVAPAGDLAAARSTGRRIRRRRRTTVAVGVAAFVTVASATTGVVLTGDDVDGESSGADRSADVATAPLDFSHGVRAYSDGTTVFVGGRSFPVDHMAWLDTDAVATEHGIVYYDDGRPMIFDADGYDTPLVEGPLDRAEGFHPTAKADASAPLVAWAVLRDGRAALTVQNVSTREVVATTPLACGRCPGLVIDALDRGVVFVRDGSGTRTWDTATGRWADFAGPGTSVADVRNGLVLYDGAAPNAPGDWRTVRGPIDAQLSFDGEHVLSWSSTLEPTAPDGAPLVIERGPADGKGMGWWTFDTDGSVMVATGRRYDDLAVYDCVLPSGACEKFGTVTGDPVFIGNDM